jgi:predicted transcriptional regulator
MGRLMELKDKGKQLSIGDIAFIVGVAERTVTRYRTIWHATGTVEMRPKALRNAEKMHDEQLKVFEPPMLAFSAQCQMP